jgi:hypothetical protein
MSAGIAAHYGNPEAVAGHVEENLPTWLANGQMVNFFDVFRQFVANQAAQVAAAQAAQAAAAQAATATNKQRLKRGAIFGGVATAIAAVSYLLWKNR